ncbi:hypothetical protein [Sphingopyxis sp.]|uniref:hypothetical protein n=1 Tax=Sphingopyxis sp. TaxID=1908224 RepID=UPI003BAC1FA4
MIRKLMALALIAALPGCAANGSKPAAGKSAVASIDVRRTPASAQAMNDIAAAYVQLSLEIGTHEDGYIDAYYGPADAKTAAEAAPRDKAALLAATRDLSARLDGAARRVSDPMERRRATFLRAQLRAAETRLLMMQGTRFAFADEAERLFGVRPRLKTLASYDADLAKVEALAPGDGPLWQRVEAYLDRFTIPKDRLQKVFDAAIARCRGRSAAQIAMPADESFRLEFVTGKSWSGYNYYQGGYHSLIQVNTDLPIRLSRALDLGCHEGYPGHHLLNMKLEELLSRGRGWAEFTVYPLYSPQSLIAEGSANYGIDLAFPGESRADTERDVLMPIAEIAVPSDDRYWQLLKAIKRVSGARLTIAQQYLDGAIDRPTAVALTQKYMLVSPERADQSVRFTEQYRSYVINYGLGEQLVQAYIERGKPNREEMWRRMAKIISEPTLPADLLPR